MVINDMGTATVNVSGSMKDVFAETDTWRDEVLLYRDEDTLNYAGPMTGRESSTGTISSNDLFHWMDVRVINDDMFLDGDLSDLFHELFDYGYDKDPSPNIDISTRQCGVRGTRRYDGRQFTRVGDAMREMARTGMDFTVIGRRILAGGKEVFLDTDPILLHDDAILGVANVTSDGSNLATDVFVFGGSTVGQGDTATSSRVFTASGRATRSAERYGLIQRSFTELLIKDGGSADANALAHLEAMQPTPIRISAAIGEGAGFEFNDLVPGRRVDVRLTEAVTNGVEVMEEMRLESVDITVGKGTEEVTMNLVPLGVSE